MVDEEEATLAWIVGGVIAAAGITAVVLWRREVHAEFDRAAAAARAASTPSLSPTLPSAPVAAQLPAPASTVGQVPASPARAAIPAPAPATPSPVPSSSAPPRLINDPAIMEPSPSLASTPTPRPVPSRPPTESEIHAALVSRLRNSEEARENFGFQSLLYSWEYTDAIPDGLMGPVTRGLIKQINMADNPLLDSAHASDRFDRQLMNRAMNVLITRIGYSPNRLLPFTLPADVVHLANVTLDRMSPNIAVLQVRVA